MCGFTGCLAVTPGVAPAAAWAEDAVRRIAHRGPDDGGTYADDRVALAFRRLAVLDPTPGGHQPMASHDGRHVVVFNGEIYNAVELADELRAAGVALRTGSDTEVLVELHARFGPAAVSRLRGMFAYVVWDGRTGELFAARDRFGIKPLYYALSPCGGLLRFASEKKALVEPAGRPGAPAGPPVDRDALRRYLTLQHVPGPATLTPGVRALRPGHTLTVRPGEPPAEARYWRPDLRPAARPRPASAGRILTALADSVRAHLRCDVPLGAFLSGGVDSAAICALAREHRPDLRTFTVGFGEDGYDESALARRTADALDLATSSTTVTAADVLEHLPRIVWHLDDPLADPSAVPLWFLAREASRHVTVVLSGEGADELFGGYRVYRQPRFVRAGERAPDRLRRAVRGLASLVPDGVRGRGLLERTGTPLARRYVGNAHVFAGAHLDRVAGAGAGRPSALDLTAPVHARALAAGLDDVATMQLVDMAAWLPGDILVKADRMTMAHGLELRVPFLDPRVFAVAAELARTEKVGGRTTKRALRRAMGMLLPPDVAARPKLGFPVPVGRWLSGPLAGWAAQLLRTADTGRYLDRTVALELLRHHRSGAADHGRRLWALLVFSLWHQIHVEGVYDPAGLGWHEAPDPHPACDLVGATGP
jgi:asparagine synthase (glutamine-hydrolysing)